MTQNTASRKGRFRFQYFAEIINELKKVVWLGRREITYLTGLVLVVMIIFGIILGFLDFSFSKLIDAILLGG